MAAEPMSLETWTEQRLHPIAPHSAGQHQVNDKGHLRALTAVWGVQRCSPSYVQLPSNYPRLRCGHRSVLGQQVLQDTWVSVTSGSEDFSFKVRLRRLCKQCAKQVQATAGSHLEA